MSKELFEKIAKEVYIVPVYVSVQDAINRESNLDIKPLVENIAKFSDDIYNLSEENTKGLLTGLAKVYDVQAAISGRLGILRGSIYKYFEKSLMTFKMKENMFFKPATNDIRDIFSVEDVKEIFKISKVYYNKDINAIIKKNLPKLVNEYMAKEISGVYVFTRAGVQLLLNDAATVVKNATDNNTTTKKEVKATPVVVIEKPADAPIKLEKTAADDEDYFIKSSAIRDLNEINICAVKPYEGGNKAVSIPIHATNDYVRVFLNILWYFLPYMGLPYFFNENSRGDEVWVTQTKNLVIFHSIGLANAIEGYYKYFYRKESIFTLAKFIDVIKDDMGYLPDKHTLCHDGREVKDVLVFDKNVIANYIISHRLVEVIPNMDRDSSWWKKECYETYNAVSTSTDFIDIGRKWTFYDGRVFTPISNDMTEIVIDYTINKSIGVETDIAKTEPKPAAVKATPAPVVKKVVKPAPVTDFERFVYDAEKRVFMSDIVSWLVDNSDSVEEENNRITEIFDAIHKYNANFKLYTSVEALTNAIRNFDGVRNPIIFE